jgi:hypothetical protein
MDWLKMPAVAGVLVLMWVAAAAWCVSSIATVPSTLAAIGRPHPGRAPDTQERVPTPTRVSVAVVSSPAATATAATR